MTISASLLRNVKQSLQVIVMLDVRLDEQLEARLSALACEKVQL